MKTIKDFLKFIGFWKPIKRIYLSLRTVICGLIFWGKRLEDLYEKDYFVRHNYCTNSSKERLIKEAQSEFIIRTVNPKKVLVAGCAAGELVRILRRKGVEAWGFDISRDLIEFAYPEIVEYLRIGSLWDIPFQREDAFDTLVAFDVFEHVPWIKVNEMVEEINRLAPEYLFTMIAHENLDIGHVTLKSLKWWERKFKRYYSLKEIKVDLNRLPKVYGIDDPECSIRIWQRL